MFSLMKYVLGSVALSSAVVYHSFKTREQFYPAMLYLSTSKLSVVILGNLLFALTLVLGNLLKKVFLGTLREAEVERLQERSKEAVMETCLAMTIFREEFNVNFVALFVSLLFVKTGHWLSQDRVEYLETTPALPRLAHFRIVTFLMVLLFIDALFLQYAVGVTLARGPSVLLYFGFEYVILASATVSTVVKYALYTADSLVDNRWENKGLYVFYLELVTDLLHIFVYMMFFLIIMKYYGFPLHLMRDLYGTIRNFRTRVSDFIRYRRVTTNMNERFADATADELERSDAICIICREEMSTAKKLGCGHLFHTQCLRSWLERQQTCPTCRASVLIEPATDAPPAAAAAAAAVRAHAAAAVAAAAPADGGLAAAGAAPANGNGSGAQENAGVEARGEQAAGSGHHQHNHNHHPHASEGAAAGEQMQANATTEALAQWYAGAPNWWYPQGLPAAMAAPTGAGGATQTIPATVAGQGATDAAAANAQQYPLPGWMGGMPYPYMPLVAPMPYMIPPGAPPQAAATSGSPPAQPSELTPEQLHTAASAAAAAATAMATAMMPPYMVAPYFVQPYTPQPASNAQGSVNNLQMVLDALSTLQQHLPAVLAQTTAGTGTTAGGADGVNAAAAAVNAAAAAVVASQQGAATTPSGASGSGQGQPSNPPAATRLDLDKGKGKALAEGDRETVRASTAGSASMSSEQEPSLQVATGEQNVEESGTPAAELRRRLVRRSASSPPTSMLTGAREDSDE